MIVSLGHLLEIKNDSLFFRQEFADVHVKRRTSCNISVDVGSLTGLISLDTSINNHSKSSLALTRNFVEELSRRDNEVRCMIMKVEISVPIARRLCQIDDWIKQNKR